ncbi:DUF2528 family protein [Klebsiella sp. P1CD1]|uniref:DUF2528 family protein n=1 Tax=Klebsiella sp. P1CD1 TaxID=2267618 RepID=UPI000F502E9C|nr:DUF2528 family protein [Klebsiella sp. P1CD1]AYW18540.1 DUF2528 family protein [Klebsiella sp. P1CD1]
MANVKKYTVDYDWKAELTVEIDHDVMTEEKLHEINNFWSNADYRLKRHETVLEAVLVMLAKEALLIALSQGYNIYGVVSEFDWSEGNGVEGWPSMDGSDGIKITHVDVSGIFDSDDITIKAS